METTLKTAPVAKQISYVKNKDKDKENGE